MLDAARGAHPAHALRHRDGWQSYLSRGRKAVLGNPRTHPADRGKVAPQAQAPAPLAQTAHLSRYLSASSPPGFGRKFLPGFGKALSLSCQEGARRECVDPNYIPIRQQMIVVGDEGPFRRCAQRCEFSIVRIPDEDEGAGIDGAGKLPFWLEEISDFLPVEAWNSAQDHFSLALGRLIPD